MKVYINGRYLPKAEATVSVFDRGLNYGDGLFETLAVYDGAPFKFKEHIARLKKGMRAINIPLSSIDRISTNANAAKKLLKLNGLTKGRARLKIIVTRGVGGPTRTLPKVPKPTIIITTEPVSEKRIENLQRHGVKAVIASGFNRPELGDIKSLNYLANVLAKAEAEKKRAFEALFKDNKGNIIEGTSTNIFVVKNKRIITPPLSSGILNGITRKTVIKIAAKMGLQVKEGPIKADKLRSFDEAFLTNSIIEIVPLIGINGEPVGTGKPGNVTRALQEAFHKTLKA